MLWMESGGHVVWQIITKWCIFVWELIYKFMQILVSIGQVISEEKIKTWNANDGQLTPSGGNSSVRWAKKQEEQWKCSVKF